MSNLLSDIPSDFPKEIIQNIVSTSNIRIERILSNGHTTESDKWYDQEQNEWVLIVKGSGSIEYEDGRIETLTEGDHLLIPKHVKHRVTRTDKPTVWLAIHFD